MQSWAIHQHHVRRCLGQEQHVRAAQRQYILSSTVSVHRGCPGRCRASRNQAAEAAPEDQDWLAKVLASSGVASRRSCIQLIKDGAVTVNNQPVTDPATKVVRGVDRICINGKNVAHRQQQQFWYVAVNKPSGYICSTVSEKDPEKRVLDLVKPLTDVISAKAAKRGLLPPRLMYVGRLDVATTGLLFLTNDGAWAQKVAHPSNNLTKEYIVTLTEPATKQQIAAVAAGTEVEGSHVTPKLVEVVARKSSATTLSADEEPANARRMKLRVVVSEGRKHEVRKLVADAGLDVWKLKRVRVGGYVMPPLLKLGSYRLLERGEKDIVFNEPHHLYTASNDSKNTSSGRASGNGSSSKGKPSSGGGSQYGNSSQSGGGGSRYGKGSPSSSSGSRYSNSNERGDGGSSGGGSRYGSSSHSSGAGSRSSNSEDRGDASGSRYSSSGSRGASSGGRGGGGRSSGGRGGRGGSSNRAEGERSTGERAAAGRPGGGGRGNSRK